MGRAASFLIWAQTMYMATSNPTGRREASMPTMSYPEADEQAKCRRPRKNGDHRSSLVLKKTSSKAGWPCVEIGWKGK